MCEFCKNISMLKKMKRGPFRGFVVPDTNENQLVQYGDAFHIWSDGGGDPFQSGVCVENVRFCPICGRKL